jgi:hypothetical protein
MASKAKKKIPGPDMMYRARAFRAGVNIVAPDRGPKREEVEMYAFLSIFHPEISERKRRELAAA